MAQTVITTDDLDGSADAVTVEFSFDGTSYSIDLSTKNRAAFEKALKPYVEAAATTSRSRSRSGSTSRPRSSRRGSSSSTRTDTAAVRAWAAEQGIEVSERGRISREIVDAYRAAH